MFEQGNTILILNFLNNKKYLKGVYYKRIQLIFY